MGWRGRQHDTQGGEVTQGPAAGCGAATEAPIASVRAHRDHLPRRCGNRRDRSRGHRRWARSSRGSRCRGPRRGSGSRSRSYHRPRGSRPAGRACPSPTCLHTSLTLCGHEDRVDRLDRSTRDLRTQLQTFQAEGVRFVSLTEVLDASATVGRLLSMIMAALVEFELDQEDSARAATGVLPTAPQGHQMRFLAGLSLGCLPRSRPLVLATSTPSLVLIGARSGTASNSQQPVPFERLDYVADASDREHQARTRSIRVRNDCGCPCVL